ncbi:MAG: hypothetical protein IH629_05390 [Thermoleophilia bacterium]|nr:hypothetical protein [Thermoleophilia bacterium]
MPWYVLLIIALASLAIAIGGLVYMGLKGWRLAKRGASISKRVAPLADGLGRRADEVSAAAERLAADGEHLSASITRLQVSLARLQVVVNTATEAMEPYLLLTGWLSGESTWSDWRRWSRKER